MDQVIWDMIGESIDDAVEKHITKDFVAATIAEWSRVNFDTTSLDSSDFIGRRSIDELESYIKSQARSEAETNLTATLARVHRRGRRGHQAVGYQGPAKLGDEPFSRPSISEPGSAAQCAGTGGEASARCGRADRAAQLRGLLKYLEPLYAERELANWANEKFGLKISAEDFMLDVKSRTPKNSEDIAAFIETKARAAYSQREIEYPVDHALTLAFGGVEASADNPYIAEYIRDWAMKKFGVQMSLDHVRTVGIPEAARGTHRVPARIPHRRETRKDGRRPDRAKSGKGIAAPRRQRTVRAETHR